jgi:NO-binding membrane sensor protein with MHYT domain
MPLEVAYSPLLVTCSLAAAIMASFAALRLTSNLRFLSGAGRKARVTQAALALGVGIWSMHFIGMLAVELPISISYDPLATLGSALIAILVTGGALLSLHFGVRTKTRIVLSGTLTGLGIVAMHYLGMSAISANCVVFYNPLGVLLAIGIGIAASIAAMELAYGTRSLIGTIAGSVVLGLAISAMHYTAMFFTIFSLGAETLVSPAPLMSSDQLAIVVVLTSFLISGLFLLSATPVETLAASPDASPAAVQPAAARSRASAPFSRAMSVRKDAGKGPDEDLRIPYERDKTIRFLSVKDIHMVKANGHYTQLFNGEEELFCPWSISRVEKSLNKTEFIRTHRSFIVGKRRIQGIRKAGDKAYCILGSAEDLEIPISRGRLAEVRDLLNLGH